MNYSEILEQTRASFREEKLRLTKDDIAFIACKKGWRNLRVNFMSPRYYRREELIRRSEVFFAYAFREYREDPKNNYLSSTLILWSPSSYFNEDPTRYDEVLKKLYGALPLKKKGLFSKIDIALKEETAEVLSEPLPTELTDGYPVYLSTVFVHKDVMPDFKLGYNLVLGNLSVSKEILFLPPRFWEMEYLKAYVGD